MANQSNENRAKDPIGSLFVPSLALSRYSTTPRGIILTLLLIEIGLTFGIPVGVAGQVSTVGSVAAFIGSLLMGLLTVRYKHKSLLLTGLVVLGASTLGLYLVPSFALFMVCSVSAGLGAAMIMPISTTLVGRHLPLKKRANVISMLMATMSVSIFVGTPIIQYLSGLGGWRLSYLVYALPLPALGLLLSFRGIPSESGSSQSVVDSVNVADGYRGVLSKISADVCLLCNSLSTATEMGIGLYVVSFFRQQFTVSMGFATYLLIAAGMLVTLGALFNGKLVNSFGRKKVTSASALLSGVLYFFFTVSPNLWVSTIFVSIAFLLSGVRGSSHVTLILEQVPQFRGTMMSLNDGSVNLGAALGSGVGGAALLWFGYRAIGPSLGLLSLVSAILMYRFVVDTSQTQG